MSTITANLPVVDQVQNRADRSWKTISGVSVRTKILGIVLALTIVLGLGVTWQVRTVMQRVFISELEARGVSVASDLSARSVDPILLNDPLTIYQLLTETIANHPDALYAFVTDENGRVLAHTFGDDGFPTDLLEPSLLARAILYGNSAIRHLRYSSGDGTVHEFIAAIPEAGGSVVRVGLSERRLTGIVSTVTRKMLYTTLAVSLVGIAAAMLLTWLLTRPILQLVQTTRHVGGGDLSARAPHWADDEIGDLADAFNQMVADLQISQLAVAEKEAARSRLLRQLIHAQEEERRRIARELHDGVGQSLTSLMVGLKLLGQGQLSGNQSERVAELRRITGETLEDVRLLSRQLRPSVLDDLGLTAALERFTADFAKHNSNISVDFHSDLGDRLPLPVETSLYRIVQEAMTNVVRHSQASTLSVLLTQRDTRVLAIIEDDGCGFNPNAARRSGDSVGLHSMSERAELLGGNLNIESSDDGTTVFVEVPL